MIILINMPMNKNDKSIQVKPNSEKSTISQTAKLKAIQKGYETNILQTIEGIYHTPKAKAKVAMPIQQQPIEQPITETEDNPPTLLSLLEPITSSLFDLMWNPLPNPSSPSTVPTSPENIPHEVLASYYPDEPPDPVLQLVTPPPPSPPVVFPSSFNFNSPPSPPSYLPSPAMSSVKPSPTSTISALKNKK